MRPAIRHFATRSMDSPTTHPEIPTGSYCYGYLPTRASGFHTTAQLNAYLETLPEKKRWAEEARLTEAVRCKYFRYIGHGRYRCKATGCVAAAISQKRRRLAEIFYRKHPKARCDSVIFGDQCKICRFNILGRDFEFPEPSGRLARARPKKVRRTNAPGLRVLLCECLAEGLLSENSQADAEPAAAATAASDGEPGS